MLIRVLPGAPLVGLSLFIIGCGGDPTGELLAQLEDSDVDLRRGAARALIGQPQSDVRVTSALARTVADGDAEVRSLSIDALGAIGPSARASLPELLPALEDPEAPVRLRAALAVQRIDPENAAGRPLLISAMRAADGQILLEIGAMGSDAVWAVPTLIGLLSHELPQVRVLAADTLGRIGPAATGAVAALRRSLRDPHVAVQGAAQVALDRIQTPSAGTEG